MNPLILGTTKSTPNSNGKPTPKQLAYANAIAERLSLTMSKAEQEDFKACSAFIDKHKESYNKLRMATGKGLAMQIEEYCIKNNLTPPQDYLEDFRVALQFLKDHGLSQDLTPTDKQLNFANQIADKLGLSLPKGHDTDRRILRRFIDDNLEQYNKAKSRK